MEFRAAAMREGDDIRTAPVVVHRADWTAGTGSSVGVVSEFLEPITLRPGDAWAMCTDETGAVISIEVDRA